MSDKDKNIMLAGYIDGELSEEEKREFENYLKNDPDLQKELAAFSKLKEMTGAMHYADIPEAVWDNYWTSLYKRLERGAGWILISISAILFLAIGLYYLLIDFFMNPEITVLIKIAVGTGILGLIVLLISAVRERLFAFKRDRYSEVKR